jgi:hypothetical protein
MGHSDNYSVSLNYRLDYLSASWYVKFIFLYRSNCNQLKTELMLEIKYINPFNGLIFEDPNKI